MANKFLLKMAVKWQCLFQNFWIFWEWKHIKCRTTSIRLVGNTDYFISKLFLIDWQLNQGFFIHAQSKNGNTREDASVKNIGYTTNNSSLDKIKIFFHLLWRIRRMKWHQRPTVNKSFLAALKIGQNSKFFERFFD